MPARTDWEKHLSSKERLPVVALVSEESLLLSEAIADLRARVLTQAADFNRDEFRASKVPIQQVVDAAGTLPMMAPARWVHLSDIHQLKAKEAPALLSYLKAPSTSTVFCLSGTKLDLRTKLGQFLSKSGSLFQLSGPKRGAVVPWIQKRAQRHNFQIAQDAAHLLSDLVGNQVGNLDMAILKAGIFAKGECIEGHHIEATVAATRIHTVFELTDAIGSRNLAKASHLLRNILDGGEHGLMVLTMIVRQLRHLIYVKELSDTVPNNAAMAQRIGVRPFVVDQLQQQARAYSLPELRKGLQLASGIDIRLKSSRLNPGVLLDQLLLHMMDHA